jgi:hypothetical protein
MKKGIASMGKMNYFTDCNDIGGNRMKYEVGSMVRIQSLEWMVGKDYKNIVKSLAGKIAIITYVQLTALGTLYRINLDDGEYLWHKDEFDPGYRPDEPLSPEGAIRAMLDRETRYKK